MKKHIFLLTGSLLLLIAIVYVQSYQPIPRPLKGGYYPQKQSEKNEQIANYRYYASYSLISWAEGNINATQTEDHPKNPATQNDNSPIYNWGLWITVAIAFFAGVQAVALIRQYCVMRSQVSQLKKTIKATKQAAEAAQLNAQAAISAQRAWIGINVKSTVNNQFSFWAINVGKTPAKIISIYKIPRIVHRQKELEIPEEYWKEGGNTFDIEPRFLPSSANRIIAQYSIEKLRGDHAKDTEMWTRYLAEGYFMLYFLGRIVYSIPLEGAAGIQHETRWLYMYVPKKGALPIPDPKYPEYNYWT
jgi:hypothetical protein